MDLHTMLQSSERNTNRSLLVFMWVLSILGVTLALILGGSMLVYWGVAQIALISLPTLFHVRRFREHWIKYMIAVAIPASLTVFIYFQGFAQVPWAFWFISLAIGGYYMHPGVAVVSAISAFAGFGAGLLISPPTYGSMSSAINYTVIGVLSMTAAAVLMYQAARRFRSMTQSLDKAAEVERMASELQSAMQALSQNAAGIQRVVRDLEKESDIAQNALFQSVAPAVRSVVAGLRNQESALVIGAEATQQIAGAIARLGQGAVQQAEEASASTTVVTRLAASASEMVTLVDTVNSDAQLASQMAAEGGRLVEQNQASSEQVQVMVEETARHLQELGDRSQKIGQVVVLIQEIASQTSLLALNAAIEAARAGEQGRGFAVVADEVRKLADRSSGATREIADLIGEVATGIQSSLAAMDQTRSTVAASSGQSARTSEMLTSILNATGRTASRMADIQHRMVEMNSSAAGLAERINRLSTLAGENTAYTEEMRTAVKHIADVADELQRVGHQSAAAMSQVEAAVEELIGVIRTLGASADQLAAMSMQGQ